MQFYQKNILKLQEKTFFNEKKKLWRYQDIMLSSLTEMAGLFQSSHADSNLMLIKFLLSIKCYLYNICQSLTSEDAQHSSFYFLLYFVLDFFYNYNFILLI